MMRVGSVSYVRRKADHETGRSRPGMETILPVGLALKLFSVSLEL